MAATRSASLKPSGVCALLKHAMVGAFPLLVAPGARFGICVPSRVPSVYTQEGRIVESSGMRHTLALLLIATSVSGWAAQPVRARHGMVVSRERHATAVGLEVLKNGGNAIDAAAAVGLALAVTHPSAGNIGGGGFMLIRLADGRTTFIDFRERAPRAASRNMYLASSGKATQYSVTGYRAVGVPGTVRGLEYAIKKYGRKPWAELVHPAVELAAKGFPVSYGLAQSLRGTRGLSAFPESKRIFLKNGKFYEAGELLVQPELARTLERVEKLGSTDFYQGETARLLAKDMAAHGGLITEADLKGYTVHERAPLIGAYRGYTIVTDRKSTRLNSSHLGISYAVFC